jgi:hypothetical protein
VGRAISDWWAMCQQDCVPSFLGRHDIQVSFISRTPRILDFKISMLLYPLAYSSTLNVVKIRLWHIIRFLYRHNLFLSVMNLHMSNIKVHQKPERLCFSYIYLLPSKSWMQVYNWMDLKVGFKVIHLHKERITEILKKFYMWSEGFKS